MIAQANHTTILDNAALAAVQYFQFDSSTGALVDLRNLTVGGN